MFVEIINHTLLKLSVHFPAVGIWHSALMDLCQQGVKDPHQQGSPWQANVTGLLCVCVSTPDSELHSLHAGDW